MLTKKQIQSINYIFAHMKDGEVRHFNEFQPEEVQYIMQCIKNQTGVQGFCIETNGTATDQKSITKFRKRYEKFKQ